MYNKSLFIAALIGLTQIHPLTAHEYLSSNAKSTASNALLPRNGVVPLSMANKFFPEVTQEGKIGVNQTAVGDPKATISVIYESSTGLKKVTLSLDQYESTSLALSAYQQAIEKSKLPGFTPISIPKLGEESFAGSISMNGETHVGLGVLVGNLIIGVTLAGYDASPNNIANLVTLASAEMAFAKAMVK